MAPGACRDQRSPHSQPGPGRRVALLVDARQQAELPARNSRAAPRPGQRRLNVRWQRDPRDGPVGFGQTGRRRRARQATATTAGPRRSRDGPNPRHSCRSSHRILTSGDRRVACDRRAEADQEDSDAPLTALCQRHCPRSDLCLGFRQRQEVLAARRLDSAERPATAYAGLRRGRRVHLAITILFRIQKRKITTRGIRTGRWAVSGASGSAWSASTRRSQHGLRSPEVDWEPWRCRQVRALDWRETLTGESPCVSRRPR